MPENTHKKEDIFKVSVNLKDIPSTSVNFIKFENYALEGKANVTNDVPEVKVAKRPSINEAYLRYMREKYGENYHFCHGRCKSYCPGNTLPRNDPNHENSKYSPKFQSTMGR